MERRRAIDGLLIRTFAGLLACAPAGLTGCASSQPARAAQTRPGAKATATAGHTRPARAAMSRAARRPSSTLPAVASQPVSVLPLAGTSRPAGRAVVYDTTVPKAVKPRDFLERVAGWRSPDFELVDRLMDKRTEPPPYDRLPPPARPDEARRYAQGTSLLDEQDPFPEPRPLPFQEPTVRVGVSQSTYHTRTPEEVLAAVEPFADIVQRDVNMRSETLLYDSASAMFYDMVDGRIQMGLANIFDYYLIRGWFANYPDNRAILLEWGQPANAYTTPLDKDAPGPAGTGIVLVVASRARYRTFGDLKGARLSLAAHYVNAPGTFLTSLLQGLQQPQDQAFFGSVTLRHYPKDAVIDLVKDKADAACVDEGTLGALVRFYGLDRRVRVLAVSPHYNVDVLFTSQNNVRTHQTQIELAERMLLTLGKDPEGQEVLFFFDFDHWNVHREGDLQVAADHFSDFLRFLQNTPVDLKGLLDPRAPVDEKTYTMYGDE